MRYYSSDGHEYEAESAEDLVRQMHQMSLAPAKSDGAWMREVAARISPIKPIRCSSAEEFVEDMTGAGFISFEDPASFKRKGKAS